MDPNELLSQLRGIHSPEAILWWPLAYGWWILALLTVITISTSLYFLVKSYKKNAWRRAALKELKSIRLTFDSLSMATVIAQINTLLKRSISSANEDSSYLSQVGDDWAATLANPSGGASKKNILSKQEIATFSFSHYLAEGPEFDQRSLESAEKWIKSLG